MIIPYTSAGPGNRPSPAFGRDPALVLIAAAAFLMGAAAVWVYWRADLTLSHFDARAHLVVARRTVVNLTPGWRQLGAVWLPLPHLLSLLPVQVDLLYRTGASAVALSVAAFVLSGYAVGRGLLHATGSRLAALGGTAVLVLNPNLLYLQATPMTEPLLFGLMLLAAVLSMEWVDGLGEEGTERRLARAGWILVLACLTRYEAWPITAALLVAAAAAIWRQTGSARSAVGLAARLAVYPVLTVAAFLLESWLSTGRWFVTSGFYVPDNRDTGHPIGAAVSVWWGTHQVSGYGLLLAATAGVVAAVLATIRRSSRAAILVLASPVAAGLLPWFAFVQGHPFRIRYMVSLVPAVALGVGLAVGEVAASRAGRRLVAGLLAALLAVEARPFNTTAPMVVESQLDRANSAARRAVNRVLTRRYDGETIMASMGSLAHYMQELAAEGFVLKDFLHEGNGAIWQAALEEPRVHVGWILLEEQARGGDTLAKRARERSDFLRGFERVAGGGGVALYKRLTASGSRLSTASGRKPGSGESQPKAESREPKAVLSPTAARSGPGRPPGS